MRIHVEIQNPQFDLFYVSASLTFLSNDWFIGENRVLLSLCNYTKINIGYLTYLLKSYNKIMWADGIFIYRCHFTS